MFGGLIDFSLRINRLFAQRWFLLPDISSCGAEFQAEQLPRAKGTDPPQEILMPAGEADMGGKGQKDEVGKLEKNPRNDLIDSCEHLWRSCGMRISRAKPALEAEHVSAVNLPC